MDDLNCIEERAYAGTVKTLDVVSLIARVRELEAQAKDEHALAVRLAEENERNLKEAEADKARLDWMDKNRVTIAWGDFASCPFGRSVIDREIDAERQAQLAEIQRAKQVSPDTWTKPVTF